VLANHFREQRLSFLELLRDLVEQETPTGERKLCEEFADKIERHLQGVDWTVERISTADNGPHLVARPSHSSPNSRRTLVLMHYDTVWPRGTTKVRSFEVDGDIARGPGILDMKGGIASFLQSLRAIRDLQLQLHGPVTALFTSDEETGSSSSKELIEQLARQHDEAIVLEPGAGAFDARTSRKGVANYKVCITGIASHAGNAPERGASAIAELARFTLFAEKLTDLDRGISVSVGRVQGGGAVNVIPDRAEGHLDVRAWTLDDAERIDRELSDYRSLDSRVRFKIEGGINRPPLEFNEANRKLFRKVQELAKRIGRELGETKVGGGSDGSFSSSVACPTVDGLGACGDGPHTNQEHIRINDTLDRTHLLTLCLIGDESGVTQTAGK
jgi:glutamate carboxypeptidase